MKSPNIDNIHAKYGHINSRNLANKIKNSEFYFDDYEIISDIYSRECPECFAKFFSKKLL